MRTIPKMYRAYAAAIILALSVGEFLPQNAGVTCIKFSERAGDL